MSLNLSRKAHTLQPNSESIKPILEMKSSTSATRMPVSRSVTNTILAMLRKYSRQNQGRLKLRSQSPGFTNPVPPKRPLLTR